ncbi:MAG: helix-turn-helix transcriptional regulator [Bacteroidia bacterium]|nr:helix-turn-helix transcriptional regulator [Bacteroidia bacterium]
MLLSACHYQPERFPENLLLNCIWRITDNNCHVRDEIILPKGTAEIIFNFSDPVIYRNEAAGVNEKLPVVFINGINTRPFLLRKNGRQNFLGIQLTSLGIRFLFDVPAEELNNGVVDISLLCKHLGALSSELYAKPFSNQVLSILNWLNKKISTIPDNRQLLRAERLKCLTAYHNRTIGMLSRELSLSQRQIRRISHEWLGMSTEEFVQYHKYLASLQLLHDSYQSLTQIGLEAGYYDQSHFIREFKSYTNLTPSQYRKANKGIPGHIYF